jgi:hypothetical protein
MAEEDIAMRELDFRVDGVDCFAGVLPETQEEAEALAASIERAVQRETDRGVADLTVEVSARGVRLTGRCHTYYTKQLAQHAAMNIPGGDRLDNCIEVS